ncbi:TPR-like protein [Auriscalpium vulgare]|uniref:TPR-like protein n=1 Tax=Auriscalpium vulgare TaxID=40419 RepID=A0ACB8R9N8_9AGAM|nr:TPR-like protein [Auriscalpium vulgare]
MSYPNVSVISALELPPPSGHPDRARMLSMLANDMITQYMIWERLPDLEQAILLHREALDLTPPGHPMRSWSLNNLATAVWTQFQQLGRMPDLEEAILLQREVLDLTPPGQSDHLDGLNNLAVAVMAQFKQLGKISDLEEAIFLHREALDLQPPGHPDRWFSLSNLGAAMLTQFEQLGRMPDLEEAILLHREALDLTPPGHPMRSWSLNNLAGDMRTKFKQLGRMPDLEEAIWLYRKALDLSPPGHLRRPLSLNSLAIAVMTQFDQLGKIADLEEAILLHREALDLQPPGHPNRSLSLSNLAAAVMTQFEKLGSMPDLREAVLLHREALDLMPPGHPGHPISLHHLAVDLEIMFLQLGKNSDLEEAMSMHKQIMSHLGHPEAIRGFHGIAYCLYMRDTKSGAEISDQVWEHFELASDYIYASPTIRVKSTLIWVELAHQHKHKSARQAYQKALLLLEQCLIRFPTPELQHNFFQTVQGISQLASNGVSWAIKSGDLKEAVEVWEQGRGILWSKMKDYRYPIEQLKHKSPVLAEQLENITQQLDQLTTTNYAGSEALSSHVLEQQITIKRKLNERWNDLVREIQGVSGFETFLTIPSFASIKRVASEGPVILVNTSQHRSDALILYDVESDPINVPLPDTSKGLKVGHLSDDPPQSSSLAHDNGCMDETIQKVISQLWEYIVCHIFHKLDELGFAKNSRIWWCLSGKLCALPIHAAQPFKEYTDPEQQLSQRYIHSYTSTLGTLIRAREGIAVKERGTAPRILAIATSTLPKVYEEIELVQKVGCDVQTLSGSEVTHSTMTNSLAKCPWIHFASHGHINTKQPFKSSFELHDNARFTILDLLKANLPNAELAVLSACHTAAVDPDNTPDEGISLAAGMQFCGFRGVVGTLWAMEDHIGPILAKEFYKIMLHPENQNKPVDFKDAAKALKAVTKEMRRSEELNALHCWVPLVHIGA